MNFLLRTLLVFSLLFITGKASANFPAGAVINSTIPTANWTVEVEDVLTIPNSSGQAPRMEEIVFGGAAGLGYLLDQRGKIYSFNPADANPSPTLFLDVAASVPDFHLNVQTGVRGMAFHPNFNNPGTDGYRKFYTSHSRNAFAGGIDGGVTNPIFFPSPPGLTHDSVVGEWTVNASGAVIPSSHREVMRIGQPFIDHNIGQIAFNPNADSGDADFGNLYVALGDGGNNFPPVPIGPGDLAQSLSWPHGSLLRIDPIASGGDPYSIPSDNPFRVSNSPSEPRNVIWANGLRNPHKFTFDTAGEGKLLIADIGQSNIEEINIGVAGANYGWDTREGTFATTGSFSGPHNIVTDLPVGHASDAFTYPVAQYDHDLDNNGFIDHLFAVTGGPIYRGSAIPQLHGRYLFGDFSEENSIYAVGMDELIQRDDFSDLANLSGGHLAPFEQLRFTRGGVEKSLIQIIRDESGDGGLNRSDFRLSAGPDGEIYLLNKHDGVVRRFASVSGLLEGDFNEDGTVDAADYTVWRDNLGVRYEPEDYTVWANNFGATLPVVSEGVPEPSEVWLLGVVLGWALLGRRAVFPAPPSAGLRRASLYKISAR